MSRPADDAETTAAEMRALSHPTRVRLWAALGEGDATISQLSNRLGLNKGNVSHHLGVLSAAGLVRPAGAATVRGGTERYFARTRDRLVFDHDRTGGPGEAMMLDIVAGVSSAEDPMVHLRRLRLTRRQALSLAEHLDGLLHALTPADEPHETYDVVAAVYRRR